MTGSTMPFSDDDLKRWERSFYKTEGCWNWIAVIGSNGYGRFWFNKRLWLAHRVAFLLAGKEIPKGFVMDHICRNRRCVNPAHLRTLTSKENTLIGEGITARRLRSPVCAKGHPWKEETTRQNKIGRQCEICRKKGHIEWLEKNKDKVKIYRKKVWAEKGV